MSHVTLIRPSMVVLRLVQSRSTCPPIGIAYLAGMLRASGHEVKVIDAVGESIFQILKAEDNLNYYHGLTVQETINKVDPDTDYLALSCMFTIEWPLMRQVIQELRKRFPDKPIIIGGEHVTATASWILENQPEVDYCVIGEGENPIVQLIEALENNIDIANVPAVLSKKNPTKPKLKGSSKRYLMDLRIKNIDDIPLPAWDLIPISEYIENGFGYGVDRGRNMPMLASRGCPYQCTFCSSPQMWTTRWVARKPGNVIAEMESYIDHYGAENFSFYDLTAIVRRDWIITFCNMILDRGLKFSWQLPSGTRSEAIDDEVARLLYKTGCRNLNYAPESGSKNTLKRIKKKVNLDSMRKSMRSCMKAGIIVKSNTIVGFPEETHLDVWKTLWWLSSITIRGVHDATVSMYIPYPGTEIFDGLMKAGKVKFNDEYFNSLSSRGNFFANISHSEHISDRALGRYIMFANVIILILGAVRRPMKYPKGLFNILFNKSEESRMEATGRVLWRNFKHLFSANRGVPYVGTRQNKNTVKTN